MVEYFTGARLLRRLVQMETQVAALEVGLFHYTSPGSFNGVSASQRIYNLFVRVSALEGTESPPIPARWLQGRSPKTTLDGLSARIAALMALTAQPPQVEQPIVLPPLLRSVAEGAHIGETITVAYRRLPALGERLNLGETSSAARALARLTGEGVLVGETAIVVRGEARLTGEGVNVGEASVRSRALVRVVSEAMNLAETRAPVIPYPRTIFAQALPDSPVTSNNWTARNIVQITAGAGPLGQVRVTFQASAAKDFRINNASIGVSAMANANAAPDNGATVNLPVPLMSGYVPAGGQVVSGWAALAGFTKDNLLVVVIDHNSDTGNPSAASGLPAFPAPAGTRQGFQANKTSYNSKAALTGGVDGVIYAVSSIEVQ